MTLSINSKLQDLFANEKAKALLDKKEPGWTDDPQLKQGMGLTLKELAGYMNGEITDEMLKEMDEELSRL